MSGRNCAAGGAVVGRDERSARNVASREKCVLAATRCEGFGMIDANTACLLAEYNAWANQTLFVAMMKWPDDALYQETKTIWCCAPVPCPWIVSRDGHVEDSW